MDNFLFRIWYFACVRGQALSLLSIFYLLENFVLEDDCHGLVFTGQEKTYIWIRMYNTMFKGSLRRQYITKCCFAGPPPKRDAAGCRSWSHTNFVMRPALHFVVCATNLLRRKLQPRGFINLFASKKEVYENLSACSANKLHPFIISNLSWWLSPPIKGKMQLAHKKLKYSKSLTLQKNWILSYSDTNLVLVFVSLCISQLFEFLPSVSFACSRKNVLECVLHTDSSEIFRQA